MAHAIDGTIGVSLTKQVAGNASDDNNEWPLGQCVKATDGQEWVYVQASGAITAYDCVAIDENYQAAAITSTLAKAGYAIGFAQAAFDDDDFGWVAKQGSNISVRVAASCAPDVQLYTSATAGVLDDTSTGTLIRGVVKIAASTTAASVSEVIAANPSGTATP